MSAFTSATLQQLLRGQAGLDVTEMLRSMRLDLSPQIETAVKHETLRVLRETAARLAFAEARGFRKPVHVMRLFQGDWVGLPSATRSRDLSPIPCAVTEVLCRAGAIVQFFEWFDPVGPDRYDMLIQPA